MTLARVLPIPLSLLLVSGRLPAQTLCDGKTVSRVEILRSTRTIVDKLRAPGWSRPLLQPLLVGVPTRESAIRPFLQLSVGATCSELRRAESERLLRLQPYLADATVRILDEPDGSVRVEVETIDDQRPIIGVGLRESSLSYLELGNSNIAGTGHLAAVGWRDGRAFRDGLGGRYTDYHVLGRPVRANVAFARFPLGSFALASLSEPFFTDLQRTAGYAGYLRDDGYQRFVRPSGDALSLNTIRERADAGMAVRLGAGGRARILVGVLGSIERRRQPDGPVVITDSGLVATADSTLRGRYRTLNATRVGLVAGVRAVTFVKAKGFDALEGVQDIGRGMQLATTIGSTISGSLRGSFVTADFYTGVGAERSFLGLRTQVEARRDSGRWANLVGSGRLAWYSRPSARQTRLWSLEYVGAARHDVPYQLTMDDPQSGIRGYAGSRVVGARRLLLRAERRIVLPGISRYLGWGVAGFADAAQMWKGTVPYGTNGTRGSVGVSLLAAVPRESRSMARVDFAFPFVPDDNAKDFSVRFTYTVAGRSFWREPWQLARARLGAVASDIFTWP